MIDIIYLLLTRKQRAEHAAQYNKYRKGYQAKAIKEENKVETPDTREYTPAVVSDAAVKRNRIIAGSFVALSVVGFGIFAATNQGGSVTQHGGGVSTHNPVELPGHVSVDPAGDIVEEFEREYDEFLEEFDAQVDEVIRDMEDSLAPIDRAYFEVAPIDACFDAIRNGNRESFERNVGVDCERVLAGGH